MERKVAMISRMIRQILLGVEKKRVHHTRKPSAAPDPGQDYNQKLGPGEYAIYENSTLVAVSSATSYIRLAADKA